MDRTVPQTGSEEIELYMRTYYSLLRSTHPIQIETLVESHMAIDSSLHVKARSSEPDISALVYSSLRLPACMPDVKQVLVGQIEKSFAEAGYTDIADWQRVTAPARRRRVHFDGVNTLAAFIASRSDIDDLVPVLTAYQIEWNKLHILLQTDVAKQFLVKDYRVDSSMTDEQCAELAIVLQMSAEDLRRLEQVWNPYFMTTLQKIARGRKSLRLQLLAGSLADYRRATAKWWRGLLEQSLASGVDPEQCPVYFVSSNTHSLANLLTGYARREERLLLDYIQTCNEEDLVAEYRALQVRDGAIDSANFLYYVLKKYLSDNGQAAQKQIDADEETIGLHRAPNKHGFDIEAQIIEVNKLRPDWFDSRLMTGIDYTLLQQSDALILNIDYPLGLAAYDILSSITEHVGRFLGIYIMGKAATLNGRVGDVMIPNVIHDEHSKNTYMLNNCFSAQDIAPYLARGMVLDNQKAISALGTFLQNPHYMSVFYHEGYTDVEMEGGPYLSAVYEAFRPKRHPQNEIVNLYPVPFDIGLVHYASDTPFSRGINLGAGSLSYAGVDSTYAVAVAILQRIFAQEVARIHQKYSTVVPT